MMRSLCLCGLICLTTVWIAAAELAIDLKGDERWWGVMVAYGERMPYKNNLGLVDLAKQNHNNQHTPLLLSNHGRFLWTDAPFKMEVKDGALKINTANEELVIQQADDKTLRAAYLAAAKKYFHFAAQPGKVPEKLFFTKPQYNTWIELMYNQNQADILAYAQAIIKHNFPVGILMIDDNWQRYYGNHDFRAEKFPAARAMNDELHQLGFKVMVWICPYVSADSAEFRDLERQGYLIKRRDNNLARIFRWWNGYSACYDLTNPAAAAHLANELRQVQEKYHVDGFKFDAGDVGYFTEDNWRLQYGGNDATKFSDAWTALAAQFPYNELRATWKNGGLPVVQRLGDKGYSWGAVQSLIPQMAAASLLGYPYICPDMIGGGQISAFINRRVGDFDEKLIVRSAQVHALMPMMQFSVAPWRVLSAANSELCAAAARLHEKFGDYIYAQAENCARTTEPIVRLMEYSFPNEGFAECIDQFMLGDKYLVAPVVTANDTRTVKLPQGTWRDDLGIEHRGGQTITIDVPSSRLPYFEKMD